MKDFRQSLFHPLAVDAAQDIPEQFTFPFYYTPHALSIMAAKELQSYLETQTDFDHNFGLNPAQTGLQIGKMFGVMVVQDAQGHLGYLAAFSGKLAEKNFINGFVATVYDTLDTEGFYKKGEAQLNALNAEIETLEAQGEIAAAQLQLANYKKASEMELKAFKETIKIKKKERQLKRTHALQTMDATAYDVLLEALRKESVFYHYRLKDLKQDWTSKIALAETQLQSYLEPIFHKKEARAALSAKLQKRLHEQYRFLNANGQIKDLLAIFKPTKTPTPPAGSGECAAPKLFQYAYENALQPIAMAEFWWGASPKSEVRQHKQFYPSCRSKCEPILGHMMQGLQVEANPIDQIPEYKAPLDIVYEDDYLLLVNKPHEFLSVPGKQVTASVLTRMRDYLPKAKGPLLVHRLDMSTSGLLLVAKNEKTHKNLQKQFITRTIKKRYVALLDGELTTTSGVIDLPLRVDLDHRPQQLVCYEHGKPAQTRYEVVGVEKGKTRIHFYPITGRTHQLRVHAAHVNGLHTAIVGDDLYGTKGTRLHLHAEALSFEHPVTQELLTITCKAPF